MPRLTDKLLSCAYGRNLTAQGAEEMVKNGGMQSMSDVELKHFPNLIGEHCPHIDMTVQNFGWTSTLPNNTP